MGTGAYKKWPLCGKVLLQHCSLLSPGLIWPSVCVFVRMVAMAPGLWAVSEGVLAKQGPSQDRHSCGACRVAGPQRIPGRCQEGSQSLNDPGGGEIRDIEERGKDVSGGSGRS